MTRRLATVEQIAARFAAVRPQFATDRAAVDAVAAAFGYKHSRNVWAGLAKARGTVVTKTTVATPFPAFAVLPKPEKSHTDADRWRDTLATLRTRDGYIRVAHLCDVHFPDHHEPALNLAYRLVARAQPQVIVVGSDTADFGLISSFTPNADADEDITDELDELRRYWIPHIDTLQRIAPQAALVFIFGNHEQRIVQFMSEHAPKLRRTVERAWRELISYQGRVMYLGQTEEVEIGHLLVKHGDKANEHVAKSLLEAESYQVSVMAGHVHRLSTYHRMGRKYPVSAITAGCLCRHDLSYLKRPPSRRWQWGSALATVDLKGTDVWFENVEFRQQNGVMTAVSDGDVIAQAA